MADEGTLGENGRDNQTDRPITQATLYAMFWFVEHPMHTNISTSIDLATQFMMSNAHLAKDDYALEALGEARTALIELWTRNRDSMVDAMLDDADGRFDRTEITEFADSWLKGCGEEVCDVIRRSLKSHGFGIAVMLDGDGCDGCDGHDGHDA